MITPVWIIGFTGHRPKNSPGRTATELARLAPVIRAELLQLKSKAEAQGGRAEFLCGVAAGADIIAAREAEALGMVVHVILPMREDLFREDFAGPEFEADWKEASRFIGKARAGTAGATFRIAHGSQLRDDCYYDLGTQIVYASDAIIALWDGESPPPLVIGAKDGKGSPDRGGTGDVVDLAKADVMPYVREDEPERLYAWLPTPVRLIHSRNGDVTGSIEHFAHAQDAGLCEIRSLQHAAEAQDRGQPLTSVQSLMNFVSSGADDWATKLRRALLWSSGLHFGASLIAAISAGAQSVAWSHWTPTVIAMIELSFVTTAGGIMVWSHFQHAHARWLELRLATELTRALVSVGRLLDPLFPIVTDHLPGWRRFCLSVGLTVWSDPRSLVSSADDPPDVAFENEKKRYLKDRIQDQQDHFDRNDPGEKHWWHRPVKLISPATAGLAILFAIIALHHKWQMTASAEHLDHSDPLDSLLYYILPVVLPLVAGAFASLQTITDTRRRAQVYPEMVERLQGSQRFLLAIRTPDALTRFVRRTEEILLDELVGWYAAAKGISH